MKKIFENRIVVIRRRTRLDDLIARFNTLAQTKFYIEHLGADFSDYDDEHKKYYESLNCVKKTLTDMFKVQIIDRTYLPNFIFSKDDIVVAVGQDGLVANTLKYLNGQSIIGVNPDNTRWDGVLLPFTPKDISQIVVDTINGKRSIKNVTMGKMVLQNGQELLAVNDFFIGQKTHTSARYLIRYKGKEEYQSSSGIIVSTGLGASGWMRSVLTGSSGIVNSIAGKNILINNNVNSWADDSLIFSVREPFPSKTTQTSIVFGKIESTQYLSIVSQMGENGVIFSDGIEKDCIEFNSGMEARISVAEKKGNIVI